MRKLVWVVVLGFGTVAMLAAQSQPASTPSSTGVVAATKTAPVSRTTKAVHYRQGGSVKTEFQATELLTGRVR